MVRHALARRASLTALGISVVAGGLIPLAVPAAADTPEAPQELVVPAAVKDTPLWERVYKAGQAEFGDADSVGAEGVFVREEGGTRPVWTRFSDGRTFEIPGIESATGEGRGTGADALAYVTADKVELRHADGRVDTLALPSGLKEANVYGLRAVADDAEGRTRIFSAKADGGTAEVVVDEPAGVEYGPAVAGDASSIVLQGPDEGGRRTYTLVDAATGKAQGRFPAVPASFSRVKISDSYVLFHGDHRDGRVLVGSRTKPSAPLADLPLTAYGNDVGLVGDWVLYLPNGPFGKVQAFPVKGGAPLDLLDGQTWGGIGQGGDSAVVVGGPDNADWAVRRITQGADGKPVVTPLKKVAATPVPVERLALAQGRLAVVDRSDADANGPWAWSRDLSTSGPLTFGPRAKDSLWVGDCPAGDTACKEYWPTGDDGFLTHIGGSAGYLIVQGWEKGVFRTAFPGGTARVRDLSGPYAVVDSKESTSTTQRVLLMAADHEKTRVLEERTPVAAALWGSWLWSAGADKGAVSAKDLKTGKTVEALNTGAPCVPDELQAVGRWLYWSCGEQGPAGVYDRTEKTSRAVPSGEALLGDGYVVTHDKAAGKLVLTGAEAAGSSRVVGELPDTGVTQRRITWTVDKFGGHLAYADAEGRIHVVPSGIARQPLTVLSREDAPNAIVDGRKPDAPLTLTSLTPSRPFGAWTLTARHHRTGKVTELASGTDGRALHPSWNGKDRSGTLMPNGQYTWTLTARPDGAPGAPVEVSGDVVLRGGASPAESSFTPVPQPLRVLDTRNGTGVRKGRVGPGGTITLDVSAMAAVDRDTTTSVALHITATNASAGTFVSAYDGSLGRSTASNLNVAAGKTVSNLVVVPVDHGKVTFYNHAGTVDLIADLAGTNTAHDEDALYRPMTPWRALDTRSGLGAPKAKVRGGSRVRLSLKGTEAATAGAVVLNVTATNVTAGTFVTALPKGAPVVGSHLNPGAGETRSNLVVVPVKDGEVDLYNHSGSVDLIADVAGYYTGARVGSLYSSLYPQRLMDTRGGLGVAKAKLGAGRTVTLTVAGKAGVPATGATAVVLNVTATNTTANTFVTAYPSGTARTSASNLNVPAGATVSNLVVVPVVDGKVTFYNHAGTADLIADVQGFFAE
ncbi:hypothetical protein ACFU3J_12155 [Streptomyces sp. NPDC057411]|uniref:hypothetical protein n=1 Tax=unclassified Streptomyces TaxID=2593676 RepID=UPI003630A666